MNSLMGLYPSEEILSFFNILSEKYLKLSRIEIALNPEKIISERNAGIFQEALLRLQKQEPIQYIIGETEFFGIVFKVNEQTLIPRPETEELVEWIISDNQSRSNDGVQLSILDIGTGSGCIAISLSKNLPNSKVQALDISEGALFIARQNAITNEVDVEFFKKDILKTKSSTSDSDKPDDYYDIIVSNPPYIREMEKELMKNNVLNYEPFTALFVQDEDPLLFYRAISKFAKNRLRKGGNLYFEINENFKRELVELLKGEGFENIEPKQDIYGKDRMVKCSLSKTIK